MKTKKREVKDRIYFLSNGKTPLTCSIPNKHTPSRPLLVVDEEKQTQRAIRYSRNQKSQFVDEQDEHTIVEPVVFQDGKLIVPKTNFQLQEFMDIHPGNESNGGSMFYEYDPEKQAQEEMEWLNVEIDAMNEVRTMEFDKLKSIATVVYGDQVDRWQSSEVRHNMMLWTRDNPIEFLEMIDDPDTEVAAVARQALSMGFVILKNNGRDLYHNHEENKTKIATIKHDSTPEDTLIQWLVSDKGNDTYTHLRSKLSE